uniref:Uncharacterized protein n=1 Tax=Cucumis melo TaxID=3656 RepID=A0A9I9D133_CUCME
LDPRANSNSSSSSPSLEILAVAALVHASRVIRHLHLHLSLQSSVFMKPCHESPSHSSIVSRPSLRIRFSDRLR